MSRDTTVRQTPPAGAGQQTEIDLLRLMAAAPSPAEQRAIGARLAAYRAERAADARDGRSLDLAARLVEQVYPVAQAGPGVRTTAASDWLGEVDDSEQEDLGEVTQQMAASATLWYRRVPDAVRAEHEEFRVQAHGVAARVASRYGQHGPTARRAFLDQVTHLHGRRLIAEQVPPGSGLPPAVENPQTFDESLWGPAGPPDPGTAQGPPSLAEGSAPEGDAPQQIENPAAFEPHDAGPGAGTQPSNDYLDGVQTPPGWGRGLTTMTSLISDEARRVLAESAQDGVQVEPHPSNAQDQLTPSQQEGGPVEGDVPANGVPPVDLTPHDAGPGNAPLVDEWDGTQTPWMASRKPLSAVVATVRPDGLPRSAQSFLAALGYLHTVDQNFGRISARSIVEGLLRTGGANLTPEVAAELRSHLVPKQAGDLPPWLKGKDGDDKDEDSKSDDDDDSEDSDDDDSGDDESDESDKSDDDDDDEDKDDPEADGKKTAVRMRFRPEEREQLAPGADVEVRTGRWWHPAVITHPPFTDDTTGGHYVKVDVKGGPDKGTQGRYAGPGNVRLRQGATAAFRARVSAGLAARSAG